MGDTHTVVVRSMVHGDERHEDSSSKLYYDAKLNWGRVDHVEHHTRHREPLEVELFNFGKKLHWHWHVYNKTVMHCELSNLDHDHEKVCLAREANMTGTGFIGEDYAVDNYVARVERHGYEAHIDVIVEAKSTTKVIEMTEDGRGHTHYFHEKRQFYELSEAAIPAATFAVPDDCPNV